MIAQLLPRSYYDHMHLSVRGKKVYVERQEGSSLLRGDGGINGGNLNFFLTGPIKMYPNISINHYYFQKTYTRNWVSLYSRLVLPSNYKKECIPCAVPKKHLLCLP
ncbi:hypothetical protein Mapa_007994 [Marchantia paleacea]|nr:hypothetical protein Mapa_007994 [Marchantia paleacea]